MELSLVADGQSLGSNDTVKFTPQDKGGKVNHSVQVTSCCEELWLVSHLTAAPLLFTPRQKGALYSKSAKSSKNVRKQTAFRVPARRRRIF